MGVISVGDVAPDFTAKLSTSEDFTLSDLRGKRNVVLYFYPKDFTSGCTKEACYFRDFQEEFATLEADIIGVSRDAEESHVQFSDSYKLNFPLISDPDNKLGTLYGVARAGGRLGIKRTTFVIDKEGVIIEIVHSETSMIAHVEKSLEALKSLG